MQWRERIQREIDAHTYSYFVTLTFSPAHLAGVLAEALKRREPTRRARIEGAAYRHVSLWLKRLRKGRKAAVARKQATETQGRLRRRFDPIRCRFFAAHEYGEELGRLHYHLIVHTDRWVPVDVLTDEWRSRADASLVRSRDGCASYVSKYLTKASVPARPRSSLGYGLIGGSASAVNGTERSPRPPADGELDRGIASRTVDGPIVPQLDHGIARTQRADGPNSPPVLHTGIILKELGS